MRALLLIAILSAGCSPVLKQTRASAEARRSAGDLVGAEQVFATAMNRLVTPREYDAMLEDRCDLRVEVARQRLETLRKGTATFADVDELHTYVRRCPNFAEVDLEITDFGAALAEERLRAEVEPLAESGDLSGALEQAATLTQYLPRTHPAATRIEGLRARLAAPYKAGYDASTGFPLAAAVYARLYNRTGSTPTLSDPVEDLAAQGAAVSRQSAPGPSVDASCAGVVSNIQLGSGGAGLPYRVREISVRNCSSAVAMRDGVETYEVPVEKTVLVDKVVKVTTPVTKRTATVERTCYTSDQGFGSGCVTTSTKYDTSTTNDVSYDKVQVEERVTVMEERTRPAKFASRTARADVTVVVEGFGGTRSTTFGVSATGRELMLAANATAESANLPVPGVELSRELSKRAAQSADQLAKASLLDSLESEFASAIGQNDARALDIALLRWANGVSLSTAHSSVINGAFGFELSKLSTDSLPAAPTFDWLGGRVVADVFEQAPLDAFFEGVVAHGYPTNVSAIGVLYGQPVQLVGQPDRSTLALSVSGNLRASLMSGRYDRGLGAMIGMDWGFLVGSRLGENYQRTTELPLYVKEDDRSERRLSLGMRVGLPVMLGFRTYFAALFAGVRPTYHTFSIGHFFSEAPTIPLFGRLELRPQERFPIIVEGWWGNLAGNASSEFGGSLMLLMKQTAEGSGGMWFDGRFEHLSLRTRIPGLNEIDDVLVDPATTTRATIGLGFAF